jgi:hypothetical protein
VAGGDFAGHYAQPGGHQNLAGYSPVRVLSEHRIEYGIGYLVRNLIRMSFGHRFRREYAPMLVRHSSSLDFWPRARLSPAPGQDTTHDGDPIVLWKVPESGREN